MDSQPFGRPLGPDATPPPLRPKESPQPRTPHHSKWKQHERRRMRKGTVSQTVLYLACKNGGKTPEEVLENTWHSFSTGSGPANVCAWNPTTGNYDRPLYYYFTTDGLTNVYCYQLLRDGDGQCHAWADLLSACWKANGIGSAIVLLAAETNSYRPAPFLVRNGGP